MHVTSNAIFIPPPLRTLNHSPRIGGLDRWEREIDIILNHSLNEGVTRGVAASNRNHIIGNRMTASMGQRIGGQNGPLSRILPKSCGLQSYMEQKAPYMTCAVAMPMDIEMLKLASSPPIFGHSFLSQRVSCVTSRCPSRPLSLRIEADKKPSMRLNTKCLRPCLVIKTEVTSPDAETSPPLSPDSLLSPTKSKKKVMFADDRGEPLTHVRVMTEPSDCPPRWSSAFLEQVTKGVLAEVSSDGWELDFPQPAAEYIAFKNRLESQNVCLENVYVNETGTEVTGTVKVKNLFFHKEVNVRVTFDQWKSYRDVRARFVPLATSPDVPHLIDTFSFNFAIPRDARSDRIDFCIQFKCEGCEFWDNNIGKNYIIRRQSKKPKPPPIATKRNCFEPSVTFNDPVHMKMDSWSEFASWNHLDIAGPYW